MIGMNPIVQLMITTIAVRKSERIEEALTTEDTEDHGGFAGGFSFVLLRALRGEVLN